jgi:hypothetical protein
MRTISLKQQMNIWRAMRKESVQRDKPKPEPTEKSSDELMQNLMKQVAKLKKQFKTHSKKQ